MAKRRPSAKTPAWIDIPTVDKDYHLRDAFVVETVAAGARSLATFMAVTYVSQFADLTSEFARLPVYTPDLVITGIPYSLRLVADLNDTSSRHHIQLGRDILDQLLLPTQDHHNRATDKKNNEYALEHGGAQLGRLWRLNQETLAQYGSDKDLLAAVKECVIRDEYFAKALQYVHRPH